MRKRVTASVFILTILGMALLTATSTAGILKDSATAGAGEELREAVVELWGGAGPAAGILKILEMHAADQGEDGAQAIFHLACANIMTGNRDRAVELARALRERKDGGSGDRLSAQLEKMLGIGEKPGSINLEVRDMPIGEVIRMAASVSGRAVIVDENVSNRKVSMFLPKVDMNQVLKAVSVMVPLDIQYMGDIVLVRPAERKLDEQGASVEGAGKISVDLKDADVRDVLRLIGRKAGLNIVFHKSVRGKVTVQLKDMEPKAALKVIARANDLHLENDGDCILVVLSRDIAEVTGRTDELAIPLNFLEPRDALALLRDAKITRAKSDGRSIIVHGSPDEVARARELLISQDKPGQSLTITLGVWEIFPGKTVDSKTFSTLPLEEKTALARLISSPRIVTQSGRKAKVEIRSENRENAEKASGDSSAGAGANVEGFKVQPLSRLSFELFPREISEGMYQLDLQGDIELVSWEGERETRNLRRISSSFVIKPGHQFAYDVQGGATPMILEVNLSMAE